MNRKDKVLVILHPPIAAHGRIMECAGCEAGFIGTGRVVGAWQAIARYRAAADMRDELDPDFVVMAQCYARDAWNGGIDDFLSMRA